ncbi:MAG: hypothetical protein ABI779_18655 [Acidobacteriota bacterium]
MDAPHETLPALAAELFGLLDSFPPARVELFDFHFKSCVEDYVAAIQRTPGRKVLIKADRHLDVASSLRKLLLMTDVMVISSADATARSGLSFFPVSDKIRSPVLGLQAVMDEGRKYRPPSPAEVAYLTFLLVELAKERNTPASILGVPWNAQETGWRRTMFTRTSEPFENAKGEACHIAAGIIHGGEIPLYDWLEQEAKPLLLSGRAVFAPFVFAAPETADVDEGALKAALLHSDLVVSAQAITTSTGRIHPLTHLAVPYLEDVPLPLLTEIIADEGESLCSFRRHVDRALEDIGRSADPAEVERQIIRIRRDLFEDELDRVRQTCERLSRMRALARIGAYVGTAAMSLAAVAGLSPPSIICGAAGLATATVAELYRNFEEVRNLRRSPMHFVWQLAKAAE